VISSAPRIVRWRESAAVDHRSVAGTFEVLGREPFDYLFRFTHLEISPDEALALPTRVPSTSRMVAPEVRGSSRSRLGPSWRER